MHASQPTGRSLAPEERPPHSRSVSGGEFGAKQAKEDGSLATEKSRLLNADVVLQSTVHECSFCICISWPGLSQLLPISSSSASMPPSTLAVRQQLRLPLPLPLPTWSCLIAATSIRRLSASRTPAARLLSSALTHPATRLSLVLHSRTHFAYHSLSTFHAMTTSNGSGLRPFPNGV